MNEIATFEKVSLEQYMADRRALGAYKTDEQLREEWLEIELPKRSTYGSAGYDFYAPHVAVVNEQPEVVATGIRVKIEPGWFLMLVPRSGLGFKSGFRLSNTAGIIDSDYYNAANEGHIMAKATANNSVYLNPGDRFMQGIFLPYGVVANDNSGGNRVGGFGSTGV